MKIIKRLGQLLVAAVVALLFFEVGPGTHFKFGPIIRDHTDWVLISAGLLSLCTPSKFKWMTLAGWAFYFGSWALYEFFILKTGDMKFGPMLLPYGVGALIFGIAAGVSASGKGERALFGKRNLKPS